MMKKLFLLFVVMIYALPSLADVSGTCGENLTWKFTEATKTLTIEGTGAMEDYSRYSNAPWFYDRSNIKKIDIKNGVTSIGNYAFRGCNSLTAIVIPNSVTFIGESAFAGCASLGSVTIPNSVTSIGRSAFSGCTDLKVIIKDIAAWCGIDFKDFDSNPTYYSHKIYSDENTEITDLVIPNSVMSISKYAFYFCSGLTSVTIPNSVTTVPVLNVSFYN